MINIHLKINIGEIICFLILVILALAGAVAVHLTFHASAKALSMKDVVVHSKVDSSKNMIVASTNTTIVAVSSLKLEKFFVCFSVKL